MFVQQQDVSKPTYVLAGQEQGFDATLKKNIFQN